MGTMRLRYYRAAIELADASVPILKFLCTFCLSVECAVTEALDGCQDVIGGFGPAERLGRGISGFDIGGDRGLEFDDGSMRPALTRASNSKRSFSLRTIFTAAGPVMAASESYRSRDRTTPRHKCLEISETGH